VTIKQEISSGVYINVFYVNILGQYILKIEQLNDVSLRFYLKLYLFVNKP